MKLTDLSVEPIDGKLVITAKAKKVNQLSLLKSVSMKATMFSILI